MEDWRAKALESFPDLQDIVKEEQGGPIGLWIELFYKLTRAYDEQPSNDDLIRRIYDYADWCLNQPSTGDATTDPSSAAAVGLFESIPLNQNVSEDLHRWISVEQFEGFENLFRYLQSDEEYLRFTDKFMRKKKGLTS